MGVKRMRPRGATQRLKAITCVNNTQNSHRIIAFVLAQVRRDLSCSGAVVDAAGCLCSVRGATAATPTAATHADCKRVGGNGQRPANATAKVPKALQITVMPSGPGGDVVGKVLRPWPINLPSRSQKTS